MKFLIIAILAGFLSSCSTPQGGTAGAGAAGGYDYWRAHYKQKYASMALAGGGGGGAYASPSRGSSAGSAPYRLLHGGDRYDPDSLSNPYGAGSRYKPDGLLNPYSEYGSKYSNRSWNNPYATEAPKLYGEDGTYLGRLSTNKYDPDSISNPYGQYGNKYSSDSVNNPYGRFGNPYSSERIYVMPEE